MTEQEISFLSTHFHPLFFSLSLSGVDLFALFSFHIIIYSFFCATLLYSAHLLPQRCYATHH